jgi:MFS family permease
MFRAGLSLFGAGSIAAALAGGGDLLIAGRAGQGIGAALAAPATLALLTATFPEGPERNRAVSVWGAIAGAGSAVGVLIGGVLTATAGWPSIFLVNVPPCLAAVVLAPRLLPPDGPVRAQAWERTRGEIAAVAAATAGLLSLVYALLSVAGHAAPAAVCPFFVVAIVLLGGFVLVQRRARDPLLPVELLTTRVVGPVNAVAGLAAGAGVGVLYLLTLYMQQVLAFTALRTGLGFLALTVPLLLAALAARRLVGRWGAARVLTAALTLAVGGRILLTVASGGGYARDLLPGLVTIGFGIGLTVVPVTLLAVSGSPARHAGTVTGLLGTSQQVGAALGVAAVSAAAAYGQHRAPVAGELIAGSGFGYGFAATAALASAGLLLTLLVLRRPRTGDTHV